MNSIKFQQLHPRHKGEDLADYVCRVICENVRSGDTVISEALEFYRDRVAEHERDQAEQRHQSEINRLKAHLSELKTKHEALTHEYATLKSSLPTMVSAREAEEGRLGAFRLAREKAATLVEGEGGLPTQASEDIRAMPEPKPKWTR